MWTAPEEASACFTTFYLHRSLRSLGYCLKFDGYWQAWQLLPGWKCDGQDTRLAEMIAVKLATWCIDVLRLHNAHLVINVDDMGVVSALNAGHLQNSWQKASLQCVVSLFSTCGLFLTIKHVSTVNNPADGPSHGVLPTATDCLTSRFRLPSCLSLDVSDISYLVVSQWIGCMICLYFRFLKNLA